MDFTKDELSLIRWGLHAYARQLRDDRLNDHPDELDRVSRLSSRIGDAINGMTDDAGEAA